MQLHRDVETIEQAGASLYVIGNGAPMFIEGFRETTGFLGPIFTDPSLKVYDAAQLKRGFSTLLGLGVLGRTIGAMRRGSRQGATSGSATQQGGILVIAPGHRVLWHHISSGPGDNASGTEIAEALRAGLATTAG